MSEIVVKIDPSKHINESSKDFSIYTCEYRAIPNIADGLKDSQRKALYVIKPIQGKIKTISLAGEMISSNLYLHGDVSAAGAISGMAAPYDNNVCWLDGIGTFGTKTFPKEIASPRYTYVKKSHILEEIMYVDNEIVPMKENYDGSRLQPAHFLPIIPTVLLNGTSGIAVGWSTDILPRSLHSLIDASIKVLDGKKLTELPPDYTYLNVVTKKISDDVWEFYGRLTRSTYDTIYVTDLPPEVDCEVIKERLIELENNKVILDFTDRSSKTTNIEIKLPRGTLAEKTDEQLLSMLKLVTRKTDRLVVIDWDGKTIRKMNSAIDIVTEFVIKRLTYYKLRYRQLLDVTSTELTYWECLKKCHDNGIYAKLKNIQSRQELTDIIRLTCPNISDENCIKIESLPLYKWSRDEYIVVTNKIVELKNTITSFTEIYNSEDKQRDIYKSELIKLRKLVK
jgi:DNA topoisomerase-2